VGLYNLVKLKESLVNTVNVDDTLTDLNNLCRKLRDIKIDVTSIPEHHTGYIDNLIAAYENIIAQTQATANECSQRIKLIDDEISTVTRELFSNNYELETRHGSFDNVRYGRVFIPTSDVASIVKDRINLYSNWKYPGLEIGCRDGEWTKYLVAADPLYVVDQYQEFLDSTNSQFPGPYQSRLRKYILKNNDITMLPHNQFGFVFSWGFFNYVSLDTMHQFLKQLHILMRPGGVFLFTYNDGDTPAGAGMAENFAQTYMPKSILLPLCYSLGFELVADYSPSTNISWLEIKKPGQLKTIKAHQALGEISKRADL